MKDPITTPGKTYAVTSPNGCTVTQHVGEATIVHDVPAGVQVLIIAQAARMEVSDDAAVVTECGGSAELVFTAATTRAASSGTGSDGMTAEERALLMGAAQRDADNTFTAGNTFTGAVDMSGAQVTPPEGWNVGDLTLEAIQQVVPMAWGMDSTLAFPSSPLSRGIVLGFESSAGFYAQTIGSFAKSWTSSIAIGDFAKAGFSENTAISGFNIAIGANANAFNTASIAIGYNAQAKQTNALAIGYSTATKTKSSLTIGAEFTETTDSGNVTHTCTTEGTGSITIGAGANTLNNGDTESSNSVTIGCKATNQGADSVVLGAQAKATAGGTVAIGAGATSLFTSSVSLGSNSKTEGWCSTAVGTNAYGANGGTAIGLRATAHMGLAVGGESVVNKYNAMALGGSAKAIAFSSSAIGDSTKASADYATAIGRNATAADYGATVIRSTAEDGTYTQLYFSGANTPLANTYEGGEAMMGYVVRDSAGNVMTDAEGNAMVGTQKLSVLFPNNRGENAFTPAMLGLDDEWTPKPMFRPSDLDMPVEEPTEPEEYTPLPVYPIVEPEIEEMEEV